jgi:AcrR family transcriptional regulator
MTVLSTKERILNSTEELVAESGFCELTMRQISTHANTNLAAINYHFGSKQSLINHMLERRLDTLFSMRLKRLDELENGSQQPCLLRQVLEAFIEPALVISNDQRMGGRRFMKILARAYAERSEFLHDLLTSRYADTIKRFASAIERACPHLDPQTVFWRFHFIMGSLTYVMADFGAASKTSHMDEKTFFATCSQQLVNFALASLSVENPQSECPEVADSAALTADQNA